eukprot:SAG31_NODE_11203_length_1054_cov_1.253403_1_plen_132_part_10
MLRSRRLKARVGAAGDGEGGADVLLDAEVAPYRGEWSPKPSLAWFLLMMSNNSSLWRRNLAVLWVPVLLQPKTALMLRSRRLKARVGAAGDGEGEGGADVLLDAEAVPLVVQRWRGEAVVHMRSRALIQKA